MAEREREVRGFSPAAAADGLSMKSERRGERGRERKVSESQSRRYPRWKSPGGQGRTYIAGGWERERERSIMKDGELSVMGVSKNLTGLLGLFPGKLAASGGWGIRKYSRPEREGR